MAETLWHLNNKGEEEDLSFTFSSTPKALQDLPSKALA